MPPAAAHIEPVRPARLGAPGLTRGSDAPRAASGRPRPGAVRARGRWAAYAVHVWFGVHVRVPVMGVLGSVSASLVSRHQVDGQVDVGELPGGVKVEVGPL